MTMTMTMSEAIAEIEAEAARLGDAADDAWHAEAVRAALAIVAESHP